MSEIEKRCSVCKRVLSISYFYRDKGRRDGHDHRCKLCFDAYNNKHTEARIKANRRRQSRYVAKYPEKEKAQRAINNAIKNGSLARQSCEKCGAPQAHAHHDDYSKPMQVRWLCGPHHSEHHRGNLPLRLRLD